MGSNDVQGHKGIERKSQIQPNEKYMISEAKRKI